MTILFYKKPRALSELHTDRHGIIAASAGTGKTYTLQHLVVEILLADDDVTLDQILLVTFTVAATSDLKAKIRETLEYLIDRWEMARSQAFQQALLVDDGELHAIDDAPDDRHHWAIDLDGIQQLRHALRNFDRAAIYTIHGFCQRILVEHAFANRRLFEQEHVSEDDVIDEALAELLRTRARPGTDVERWLRIYFDGDQGIDDLRQAMTNFIKCSGQYRPNIDLDEFQDTIQSLADDLQSLDVEAWKQEMKPRVDASDVAGVKTSTVNAIKNRIQILIDDVVPQLKAGDPTHNLFLLNEVFRKKFDYLNQPKSMATLALADQFGQTLLKLREFNISREQFVVPRLGELLREMVADLKSREGYFTFADMVDVVRDTLLKKDEKGHLLASIRANYRYGLIDEFQDTDRPQWEIFEKIFVEADDGQHFLYLVGDPKQAIYGFRGGDVYTYLDACDRLRSLGDDKMAETSLEQNFRSTTAVISSYNAIFERGDEAIELGDRIAYSKDGVATGKPSLALEVDGEISPHGLTAFLLESDQESPTVSDIRAGLAEYYAREISRIVHGDKPMSAHHETDGEGPSNRPLDAGDIYVLCRRRNDLDLMADALRRRDVDFAFLKKPGLFQTQEARDIYDLLLALADPYDRSRRARAWMTPFFDLRLHDLEAIFEIDDRSPIFARLLRWSRLAKRLNFAELFDTILQESGAIRRRILLSRGERELTNLIHILELLAGQSTDKIRTVEDLAARLKGFIDQRFVPDGEDTDQQRIETEEKAVQLMTIHASKGLQSGLVFVVPRLSKLNHRPPLRFHDHSAQGDTVRVEWHEKKSRLLADDVAQYRQEIIAEELRLVYVALTRAQFRIYLPIAEPNSKIYKKLAKDPFTQIIDRIHDIRDDHPAAHRFDIQPRCIDVEPTLHDIDEVRRGLRDIGLDDLAMEPMAVDPDTRFERHRKLMLRRWEITSYSKLKDRRGVTYREDEKSDDDAPIGQLPGGMATGNFIHKVLEDLDYHEIAEYDRQQWLQDPHKRQFFVAQARRYGRFDEPAIGRAMEIVFDCLRAPIQLDNAAIPDGLYTLDSEAIERELEFLFPIPQCDIGGDWRRHFDTSADVDAGFVTGIVDLLFRHDSKIYFADWKSDLAHPFDDASLARMIEERYATQANLYSLALCRMLGIDDRTRYERDFGGYFYFFVRGMTPESPGRGIYQGKVDWDILQTYETRLFDKARRAKTDHLVEPGA